MVISKMEGSQRKEDVQDRRLSLIDVSSADDSLIDTLSENPVLVQHQCSENQGHVELMDTPNSKKLEEGASKVQQWVHASQPNGTSEVEMAKKNTKCNLRKSLAWDSAFFTSAGVLDPEELSCIIEGVEKEEKHVLAAIQEDVHNSCESFSTLESDNFTLDSLEADLFEDIRASIQKSSKKSNVANSKSNVPSGVAGFLTVDSLKKIGMASQDKIEAPPASKNPSSSMPRSGKMTKKTQVSLQLSQKPAAPRGEPSNIKLPKVPGKSSFSSTISAKRASIGDLHVKSEKEKAKQVVGGRVSSVSKEPVSSGSRGIVPKPTLSSKSTSGPSVATKIKPATSLSSLNALKRKVGAGITKPPSSGSALRTPSRVSSRYKTDSSLSACLTSVTKLSSSTSPASSISDWSSDSSSSTYSKQRSNSSRTSVDSISSKRAVSDADTLQASHSENLASDSSSKGHENQVSGFVTQCARVTSTGMVLPPARAKPSALRLPSPKIGFFDGVKSSVRTPQGGTQSHSAVPHGSPKFGAGNVSPSEGKNNAKFGKLQPARSIKSIESPKPIHQQISHPIILNGSSDVASKTSSASQKVDRSSEISIDIKNKMLLLNGAGNLKAENTMTEGVQNKLHVTTGAGKLKADNTMIEGVQNKMHLTTGAGELKADNVMTEGLLIGSTYTNGAVEISVDKLNSKINFENKFSSQIVGEGSVAGQFNLPKAEDAPLLRHDNGMNNSDMHCKDIFESSMHKLSAEGSNGLHLKNYRATPTDAACNNRSSSATYMVENTAVSNVVGEAPVDCQLDLLNDLYEIKCFNDQKTCHYDDQVDSLSRKIDAMDINTGIQKSVDGDSQSDISFQDKPSALEVSSHKELLDCVKMEESLDGSLTPGLSLSHEVSI